MKNDIKQDANLDSVLENGLPYPPDDEINLYAIWLILKRRKQLFFMVFLCITLSGSLYGILKRDVYSYSAAIQIGTFFVNGKETLLENAKNVESKVKETYIDSALNEYYQENPGKGKKYKSQSNIA